MAEEHVRPYIRSMNPEATVWYAGELLTFLAESAETGGQLTVMEATARRGSGPPIHVHSREDEAFYVLDGLMPRNIPHGFVVVSETAKLLGFCMPGGLEGAFHELSEPAKEMALPPSLQGPPDVERMISVFGRYGNTPAGPPLEP